MNSFIRYLVYSLLLVIPFAYFPAIADPFEYPKAIVLIFTVLFAIGLTIGGIITGSMRNVKFSRLLIFLLVYLVVQLLTSTINNSLETSFWGQYYRYQGLITLYSLIGLSFILSQLKLFKIDTQLVFQIFLLGGLISCFLVIIQGLLYHLDIPVYTFYGRMTALLGNPNFTGGFLAIVYIFSKPFVKNNYHKTALFLLFFISIVLTASRGALIAFGIGNLFIFLPHLKSRVKLIGMIAITSLVLLVSFPFRPSSAFEDRGIIWNKALDAFLDRPVLGWGVEQFEVAFSHQLTSYDFDLYNIRVDKAHNELLEIAVASGIVGLVTWITIVYTAFSALWKNREQETAQLCLWSLLIFLILSLTNVVSIAEYVVFYTILGITATLPATALKQIEK